MTLIQNYGNRQHPGTTSSVLSTYPIRTLSAPSGVTNIAGANAYAAKLNTSPSTTAIVS